MMMGQYWLGKTKLSDAFEKFLWNLKKLFNGIFY